MKVIGGYSSNQIIAMYKAQDAAKKFIDDNIGAFYDDQSDGISMKAFIAGAEWQAANPVQSVGMRWVKPSDRLPVEFGDYVAKEKGRHDITKVRFIEWEPGSESHISYWATEVIEWLDETPAALAAASPSIHVKKEDNE